MIIQICIFILSISALIMLQKGIPGGNLVGLYSQIFWLYSTMVNEQWGMFAASVVYTIVWLVGIYNWLYVKPVLFGPIPESEEITKMIATFKEENNDIAKALSIPKEYINVCNSNVDMVKKCQ